MVSIIVLVTIIIMMTLLLYLQLVKYCGIDVFIPIDRLDFKSLNLLICHIAPINSYYHNAEIVVIYIDWLICMIHDMCINNICHALVFM